MARFLVFFETAASATKDPQMRWAASVIARKFVDFKNPTSVGLGYMLLDVVRWGKDIVAPVRRRPGRWRSWRTSQGKKIVFRDVGRLRVPPISSSITGMRGTAA